MDAFAILALVSCVACFCTKFGMAFREKNIAKLVDLERDKNQASKTELSLAVQKTKFMKVEQNQLEIRQKNIEKTIITLDKQLEELSQGQKEEKDLKEEQARLIRESRHRDQ